MANFGTATFTAVLNNAPLLAGASQANTALTGISKGMGRVGTAITQSVTVPTVLAGGVATAQAVRIESAWNEVRKVYNDTAKAIERMVRPQGRLGKAVSDITLKYGLQREQVIGILGDIAAMGYTGKDATDLLRKGIEYSVASGIEMEDGLNAVVALMATFQLRGKKLNDTLAGLNLTENETAARGFDLSVGLARAGGAAEALINPSFKANDAVASIAAGMAVLKERGQETYRSADALRAIFQRLYQAPGKTEELGGLFGKMGVEVENAAGELVPFPDLLKDIATNFDKLSDSEKQAFTSKSIGIEFGPLFGQIIRDVQRGVESGDETNSRYLNTVSQFGDTAKGQAAKARELKIAQDSMAASVGRVRASWDLLVDTLTPIINKYLKPITKYIAEQIQKFSELPQAQQESILKWVALGAAIGPVLVILSTIGGAISSAIAAFGVLAGFELWKGGKSPLPDDLGKRIWSGLKTAFLWAIRGMGGIILSAMASLSPFFTGALMLIGAKLAPVIAKFGKFFGVFSKFLGPIFSVLGALNPLVWVIGLVVAAFIALSAPGNNPGDMMESLKEIFFKVVDAAKKLWEAIQPILKWLQTNIAPLFRDAFLDIFDAIGKLMPVLKVAGALLGGAIVAGVILIGAAFRVLAAVIKWVAGIIGPIFKWIWDIFYWLYDELVGHSIVPDLIKGIIKWFTMIKSVVWPIVKAGLNLIMRIFKAVFPILVRAVKVWWAGIKLYFSLAKKFITGVLIPIVKFLWKNVFLPAFKAMKTIVKIWWAGVKIYFKAIWAIIKNVVIPVLKFLWNKFKEYFPGIARVVKDVWANKIKPVFTALKNFITDTLVPVFKKGIGKIKSIWSSLKDAARAPVEFIVNTVYMGGIRPVLNAIPGVGDLPSLRFATGGAVPFMKGSRRGRDSVAALLTPDEHVWTDAEVRAFGGHKRLEAFRQAVLAGKARQFNQGTPEAGGGGVVVKVPKGADVEPGWVEAAKKLLAIISRIKGWFGDIGNMGQWGDMLKNIVKTAAQGTRKGINGAIPGPGPIPDIFDSGGWLQPGQLGMNTSTRPEPVFTNAQWGRLFPALDTISHMEWKAPRFDPGDGRGNNGDSREFHYTINNPAPERASRSVSKTLRRTTEEMGWV